MEKQTKGSKTKQLLYQCALALFREKGYDNVSVGEIVEKAGTAKGTFYIHFQSKAAVITEMLQEYDEYYDKVAAQMDQTLPIPQQIEAMVFNSCQFTQTKIGLDLIRILYTNQLVTGQLEQDALNQNRKLYQIIHKLLTRGQEQGIYQPNFDVDEMGAWLVRCIRGTFYEWCMQEGRFDLCAECVRFVNTFCRGLELRSN